MIQISLMVQAISSLKWIKSSFHFVSIFLLYLTLCFDLKPKIATLLLTKFYMILFIIHMVSEICILPYHVKFLGVKDGIQWRSSLLHMITEDWFLCFRNTNIINKMNFIESGAYFVIMDGILYQTIHSSFFC